ncbi:DNA primase large subunit [Methanoculleus chikugoensis]|uniref:DNA primase large subunit PriL n=1 Tax=Methanoculleus chikugoensis TaxID=118126 RepID=A0A1M4ML89_9EURY|nr:DNA primase regulatory subunit PriL [Methanoculleus chikugoensis]MDD4566629.1 DNA primase regulatory subunit PriL [Methanoculleus chikugoensis]NMA11285.1 DNA primase regulatory subunit PriL [Methanomicrobiales archaeon]SCL75636.1 DNA primase large subunit [Methanoculleus chikugoensis]
MDIVLDRKELIKYPFLKESQQLARRHVESLEEFLGSSPGAAALERAKERVVAAVTFKKEFGDEDTRNLKPELEIASYALARMLVSCVGDRSLIDRLARYEAERASFFLAAEEPEIRRFVAKSVGIDTRAVSMPVTRYVELVPHLRDKRWRLVNRDVRQGGVNLEPGEIDELIRERIRAIIADQLPLRVPGGICERLAPVTGEIAALQQQQALEQFGEVREEAFPPCIGALIQAITAGTNLTHMGRFAITAFLHTIGMNVAQIADVFARAPDFDPDMTMYQVEHISGRGGTEYTPPSCATMRTFGLCANRDKDCERVNHPLSYYRLKKNIKKKRS